MDLISAMPILVPVGIFVGAGFIVLRLARKQVDKKK
jgi:hypothetical protein